MGNDTNSSWVAATNFGVPSGLWTTHDYMSGRVVLLSSADRNPCMVIQVLTSVVEMFELMGVVLKLPG